MLQSMRKKGILWGMLIFYVILNLFLVIIHEPWRDEAQVWLLCRDLSIPELFRIMSYEGHSCLWHLLIYPFVHLGLPIFMQNVVGLLLVSIAAWWLLFQAKFPVWMKGILLISPFMTYHFPVIARCYSMAPIILFLAAMWYRDRKEHPFRYLFMVSLVVHIHVVMIVTAFTMSLGFLIETIFDWIKKQKEGKEGAFREVLPRFAALFLPLISVGILLAQLLNMEKSSLLHIKTASIHRTLVKIGEEIIEAMGVMTGLGGRKALLFFLLVVAFVIVFILIRMKTEGLVPVLVIIATPLFQFWLYAMAYGYSIQRILAFIFVLLWGMWIALEAEPVEKWKRSVCLVSELLVCGFALLMLVHMYPDIQYDVSGPYSGGMEAAEFVENNIPEDALILTDNEAEVSAILPYISKKEFYYVPANQNFSYVFWDENWAKRCTYEEFQEWLNTVKDEESSIYMISSTTMSYIDDSGRLLNDYELVFQSSRPSVKGEDYQIYRIK